MENLEAYKSKIATIGMGIGTSLLILVVVASVMDLLYWHSEIFYTIGPFYLIIIAVAGFLAVMAGLVTGISYFDYLDQKYG